jgi:hypothetical protein
VWRVAPGERLRLAVEAKMPRGQLVYRPRGRLTSIQGCPAKSTPYYVGDGPLKNAFHCASRRKAASALGLLAAPNPRRLSISARAAAPLALTATLEKHALIRPGARGRQR